MTILEETFVVAADHPALAGHFPGNPLVPAVVLLDQVLAFARRSNGSRVSKISRAKFRAPLHHGIACLIRLSEGSDQTIRVSCTAEGTTVFSAILEYDRNVPAQ